MEPFALVFMLICMSCVTGLAIWTLSRTIRSGGTSSDDDE